MRHDITEIRRRQDGSIDKEYYVRRAHRLRNEQWWRVICKIMGRRTQFSA